jgi:hypothetical protein
MAGDPNDDPLQLDLFVPRSTKGSALEQQMWLRRQDRREADLIATMDQADAQLVPLILSLARLAAQRDAAVFALQLRG